MFTINNFGNLFYKVEPALLFYGNILFSELIYIKDFLKYQKVELGIPPGMSLELSEGNWEVDKRSIHYYLSGMFCKGNHKFYIFYYQRDLRTH